MENQSLHVWIINRVMESWTDCSRTYRLMDQVAAEEMCTAGVIAVRSTVEHPPNPKASARAGFVGIGGQFLHWAVAVKG